MLQLYMNASFRAWTKIYQKNKEKREKEIEDKAEKYAYNSDESSEYIVKGSKSKRQKKEEEEWEYVVEDDIEINDSEFLEEDEEGGEGRRFSDDDAASDYDNEIDSSRML